MMEAKLTGVHFEQLVDFQRPTSSPCLTKDPHHSWKTKGLPCWQSGKQKRLQIEVPPSLSSVEMIEILGVFAFNASQEFEAHGTVGALVEIRSGSKVIAKTELINSRHYVDAADLGPIKHVPGDGTSLETDGTIQFDDQRVRVDSLSIDIPVGSKVTSIEFINLDTPSQFAIFDVNVKSVRPNRCPFHSEAGLIPFSEIPSIVRVCDRVRMQSAIDQLVDGIHRLNDLDDARGKALTFLAIVTAATLEIGGAREMPRIQLEAARTFDKLMTSKDVAESVISYLKLVAPMLFGVERDPHRILVDTALCLIERNYAKKLSDTTVARHLGLSTSHFRHLFKEATGQPFHQYLMALRLEKAHAMISQDNMSITEVAEAVGFSGVSHFSRAFTSRFSVRPSEVRST